jgi:hypothetical protein
MKMKIKNDKTKLPDRPKGKEKKNDLSGYPIYPTNEDIYSQYKEDRDINPEDISHTKKSSVHLGANNVKDFDDDVSGSDLDIPGAELDDNQELADSEDEENSYYSLGGDNHNDLEEDKGA